MSYDTKCYDLAKAFLSDVPKDKLPTKEGHDQAADELAQEIQDAIEDFLIDKDL